MAEKELIEDEEVKEKKKSKSKTTKEDTQEKETTELELILQDPAGSKLYRIKQSVGYKYTGFTKTGMPLSDIAVKQMMFNAGISKQAFGQTPFQLQRSPFSPQQPTYQVPIYRAQTPMIRFPSMDVPQTITPIYEEEEHESMRIRRKPKKKGRK